MNTPVFLHMLTIFGSLVLLILLAIFIPVILMMRKTKQQHSWDYIVDVQPADNGILVTEKSRGTPRTFTLPITATQDIQTCLGLIRRGLK